MGLELLAPAGSPEALTAAVQAGAGAVYLGCGDLNARRNAKNFSEENLEESISYCHLRGVKVYLTLNTLLTDRELPAAARMGALASRLGADAVLVQDLGVARLLRKTVPDLPLHASTQMTVHTLDGVKVCAELGMTRAVLARELSRDAIEEICAKAPIEIEVFVHGALCMCYSGQCAFSSVLGGRSGNRGLCAQPCRLAYTWPGEKLPCHPLSLKDLSLAGRLRELEKLGVACLKIEGRMKRAEYVSVVTGIFAAALREGREPTGEERKTLEAAFSRQGFTQGYYLDQKGPDMFGVRREGARDPEELFARARAFYSRGEHRTVPVSFTAKLAAGQPFRVTVRDEDGHAAAGEGELPQPARTRALNEEILTAQLSKTGGTVYHVQSAEAEAEAGLSLPVSAVNGLRRQVLEELNARRIAPPQRRSVPCPPPEQGKNRKAPPDFALQFRRWDQVTEEILEEGPAVVYLPAEEYEAHPAELEAAIRTHPEIEWSVTLPRIAWDGEKPALLRALGLAKRAGAASALVGNLGHLAWARELGFALRGDWGLGWSNSLGGLTLKELGLVSCTASFEWRLAQIRDWSKAVALELLVYGRLPLMVTENCILKNRGKGCLCEKGTQTLRDRKGETFPVLKAWGCRNEILNGRVLWLADKKDWRQVGAALARLSFTTEGKEACLSVLRQYRTSAGVPPEPFTRGLCYREVE